MSLQYQIVPNALTSEPSYRSTVIQNIIDTQQVIDDLSLRMPHLTKSTLSSVIEELSIYTREMLTAGHSINITGFVRFFHSIPGRLNTPDSSVTASSVQVQTSISTVIEQFVKNNISLQQLPFVEKTPSISSITDSQGRQNYLGDLLVIKGNLLDFDENSSDQGIFVDNTYDDSQSRMSIYATVTNTQVIGMNNFITTPITNEHNEFKISVKAKYTPNGTTREAQYRYPSRYARHLTDTSGTIDNPNIYYSKYEGDFNGASFTSITYDNAVTGNYSFELAAITDLAGEIRPDSQITFTVSFVDTDNLLTPGKTVKQSFTFFCYENEIPVTSFTLDGLSIDNANIDNKVTSLTIQVPNIEKLWKVINFNYGGEIDENILLTTAI